MKIKRTKRKLKKIWGPILKGWLEEANIEDTEFSVTILPTLGFEGDDNYRGDFNLRENLISLPVGSNDLDEIKFCFFHEVGHYSQFVRGSLSISLLEQNVVTFEQRSQWEYEANQYALDYGATPSKYVKESWKVWGFTPKVEECQIE